MCIEQQQNGLESVFPVATTASVATSNLIRTSDHHKLPLVVSQHEPLVLFSASWQPLNPDSDDRCHVPAARTLSGKR